MSTVWQAILARVDEDDKSHRVRLLAASQIYDGPTNSASLADDLSTIPAVEDLCSFVEQKLQNEMDADFKTISINKSFDLHYQLSFEADFTTCFISLTGKEALDGATQILFDNLRNAYTSLDYLRIAIISSTLSDLPQFQQFIDQEVENLNLRMDGERGGRISVIQQQVDDVKTQMSDNVLRVMERGERLEHLDARAESLQQSSAAFKTSARRVQRNMCLKNLKWTIILGIVITLLIILGIVLILKTAGVIK